MLQSAKTLGCSVLPARLYRGTRRAWRAVRPIRDWISAFGVGLGFIAKRSGVPRILLFFGVAPGDDLLCTAVLRELRRRSQNNIGIVSNYPELFEGLNDAMCVVPVGGQYEGFAKVWRCDFRHLEYARIDWNDDRSTPPRCHIIAELCTRAGITGAVAIRPYLLLTESEKARAAWAKGRIAIQSSGLASQYPMRNKQWYPERFQAVVDALRDEFEFVQLGSAADPALEHVKDIRGNSSIREAAAILHQARLYVGNVGFLMHLARSVECPSVITYGGREGPWQSGYVCNKNLYTALPCAPCWRLNTCDFDRKCMKEIMVDDVVFGIREMMSKTRNPLLVETVTIEGTREGQKTNPGSNVTSAPN